MNGKRLTVFLVIVAVLGGTSALQAAEYTSIGVSAFDGVNDGSFDGTTLNWSVDQNAGAFPILTLLEDTGVLGGAISNVVLSISTTFVDFNQTLQNPARAYFTGGNFSLSFNYGGGGGKEISGPITELSVEVTSSGPGLSVLSGIGLFDTGLGTVDLPGSNNWPAGGLSTVAALTFAINGDLTNYDWSTSAPAAIYDSQFTLFPDEQPIPEPASLMLLVLGAVGLLRMRRA